MSPTEGARTRGVGGGKEADERRKRKGTFEGEWRRKDAGREIERAGGIAGR